MGETVLLVAVLLLALYGCVELMRELVTRLMAPSHWGIRDLGHSCQWSSRRYRVCYSFGDGGMPLGRKKADQTGVAARYGLDAETRRVAEKLCEETGGVGLCRPAELNLVYREDLQ